MEAQFCQCGHSEWRHHSFNQSCLVCDCDRFTAQAEEHEAPQPPDDAIQKLIKILKEKPNTWAMEEAIQLANEVAEELRQSRLAGQLVSRQLSDAAVEIAMSKSGAKGK